ncbi:MAG: hypothetical protein QME75_01650 [Deltaproteobacteria bacterium]|nr:hypothetical protein [Deltaproteobacteria bacterium]
MSALRFVWFLLVCVLLIALAWADCAWGRASQGPSPKPRVHAADKSYSDTASYRSFLGLLKIANVSPNKGERLAALLRLGGRAETQGRIDLAVKVYTLATLLHPDSHEVGQAGCRRLVLQFYLDLGGAEPYQAFKNFLAKISALSEQPAREQLQMPFLAGWHAVEQSIHNGNFADSVWLERALVLWEMHPPGTQPPQAALLVGRLLGKQGLFTEAGKFLAIALDKGDSRIRSRTIMEYLQMAWAADGISGFMEALARWRQDSRHLVQALQTWPLRLCSPDGAESKLSPDYVNNLTELLPQCPSPPEPQSLLTIGDEPLWMALLSQPLPALLEEYLVQSLARRFCSQANFSQASRLYRTLLADAADKETSCFYWDRLGQLHIKEQQPALARDIFRTLAGEPTKLWQLLAQTRQLDVELNRLRAEPAFMTEG